MPTAKEVAAQIVERLASGQAYRLSGKEDVYIVPSTVFADEDRDTVEWLLVCSSNGGYYHVQPKDRTKNSSSWRYAFQGAGFSVPAATALSEIMSALCGTTDEPMAQAAAKSQEKERRLWPVHLSEWALPAPEPKE